MLCVDARFRHSRKLEGLSDFLMWAITWLSESPVTFRISSKVIRSAQAAQIIQSGLSLEGSGFLTRVVGILDCFDFMINSNSSRSFKFEQTDCPDMGACLDQGLVMGPLRPCLLKKSQINWLALEPLISKSIQTCSPPFTL